MIEQRKVLSSFFFTVLLGHAYAALVPQIQGLLRLGDVSFENLALLGAFFCISIRFFIGNQLHLLDKSVNHLPGSMWLYDVMVITMQAVALIALAGTCSVDISKNSDFGFLEVTIGLYAMDIIWIASLWFLGEIKPAWKRGFIPWGWAILNTVLIFLTILISQAMADPYSTVGMALILLMNIIAFLVDVVLIDFHKALEPG
jgi:hypothetical protein